MKVHVILLAMLVPVMLLICGAAADSQELFNSAGAIYSASVDLANEGKYPEALDAADRALAMNVTSLNGVIQSNRAGILVMLQRYDEAITAADAALTVEGNLTTVHSVAWYNKGNALRALGRIPEAQVAYNHAFALDNTLVPPDMSGDVPVSPTHEILVSSPDSIVSATHTIAESSTQKSPLSAGLVLAAFCVSVCIISVFGKK
jgi:tetratricopeptide (TPR) repeat protein